MLTVYHITNTVHKSKIPLFDNIKYGATLTHYAHPHMTLTLTRHTDPHDTMTLTYAADPH